MIRPMRGEDIPEVARMERRIFSVPWSEKSFLDAVSLPGNIYLVSVFGEEIAGYCGLWTSFDTADLCNIAVAPEYRRQGIAGQLLREAAGRAAAGGVQRILLEVRESNRAAISLYESFGFAEIGRRKKYYRSPDEDAVIMQGLSH